MSLPDYSIVPQQPGQQSSIEQLLDKAFGLSRMTKTSYRLREAENPVEGLSFVARTVGDQLLGAISFWSLRIGPGGVKALLLGPLAVDPAHHGQGIGLALMRHGLSDAGRLGHTLVLLVGDRPYYERVGFTKVPAGRLILPGPVDMERLLYLELRENALSAASGLVLSPHRFNALRDTTSG